MKISFYLKGLGTEPLGSKISQGLLKVPGVTSVHIEPRVEQVHIQSSHRTSLEDIVQKLIEISNLDSGEK